MKKKVLFIRHAESEYNLAQRLAKNSIKEVTLEEECHFTKYSPKLIDCPLTEAGIAQCDPTKFHDMRIESVIVSPLLRAVQTAYYLFKDHPNKPKFIVEPYLREMLLSSCDVGGRLEQCMNDFPFVNFDRLISNPFVKKYPNVWSLEYIFSEEKQKLVKEYIGEDRLGNGAELILLEYLQKHGLETFQENDHRVQKCKEFLTYEEPFVCVTHSRTIHSLSGKFIANCEGIEIDI